MIYLQIKVIVTVGITDKLSVQVQYCPLNALLKPNFEDDSAIFTLHTLIRLPSVLYSEGNCPTISQ